MKKTVTIIFAVVALSASFCGWAQEEEVTRYFSKDEMPNLIKCLPAPPDTVGADFAHDIMRYLWGKTQRGDAARTAIARRDAVWSYDSLFAEFSVPFGLAISREGTPEIYRLLVNSLSTIDQTRKEPKAYYKRKRPFVRFQEHLLTVEEEQDLKKEGSYPSGHSQRGYAAALLLSEVNPANADTLMARGYMYGESRVIVGAHWQSDVDASRLGAAIGLSRLHTSPEFLAQLAKAQTEFRRLTGALSPTDDASQFVNLAEAVPNAILEIRQQNRSAQEGHVQNFATRKRPLLVGFLGDIGRTAIDLRNQLPVGPCTRRQRDIEDIGLAGLSGSGKLEGRSR